MPRPKRNPSNTVQSVVEAAQAAAAGDLPPPDHVFLRECDRPHWRNVVRGRARKEWTDADLVIAANLARCFADIERLSRELNDEGDVLENARGTIVANPKHALLETLSRRQMALYRSLQMQPAAQGRLVNAQGARKAEQAAREAQAQVRDEDDLIPLG